MSAEANAQAAQEVIIRDALMELRGMGYSFQDLSRSCEDAIDAIVIDDEPEGEGL